MQGERLRRDDVIATIRAHRDELLERGVATLSLFGSVARGDNCDASDVDVAVRLRADAVLTGFDYFGQIDQLKQTLGQLVGRTVDIVVEPVRKDSLRAEIESDRVLVF